MSSGRIRRIRELLLAVVDLDAAERADHLDDACRDDPELRHEVESLLKHDNDLVTLFVKDEDLPLSDKPMAPGIPTLPNHLSDQIVGREVSHYRILKAIGRGGMGDVFLAEDLKLGRMVAIKFLSSFREADSTAGKRFLKEARTASTLDHPNIAVIHEIDHDQDGRLFIVMRYYDSGSVKDRLDQGPLEATAALELITQVARGLRAAHERGIVHRDLKPANVMLTREGNARIIDFGLAKLATDTVLTKTGSTLGTVAYMSPEQVRGLDVDSRSDLFSLGVLFYEMLTCVLPFKGDNPASLLYAIAHNSPTPLPDHLTGELPGLQPLLDRLLAKEAGERYQSVAGVLRDLDLIRGGLTSGEAPEIPAFTGSRESPPLLRVTEPIPGREAARPWLTIMLSVVVVGLLLWWLYPRGGSQSGGVSPDQTRLILVSAFENRTGDPDLDYLSEVAAEEVAHGLCEIEGIEALQLAVPLNEDSPAGSGEDPAGDTPQAPPGPDGIEGGDAVVLGAYFLSGDTLLLRVRVYDPGLKKQLFSLPIFRTAAGDVGPALQAAKERVMGGVAATFATVFNEPVSRAPTYAAYRAYVAAQQQLFRNPHEYLSQAVAADSTFYLPRLLQGANFILTRGTSADSILGTLAQKRSRLSTYEQHRLDMHLAESRRNFQAALRLARLAEKIAPSDFLIKYLISDYLFKLGRPRLVLEIDTDMRLTTVQLGHEGYEKMLERKIDALHLLGEYDKEMELAASTMALFPANNHLLGLYFRSLAAQGRVDEMMARVDEVFARPEQSGDVTYTLLPVMMTLRAMGDPASSRALANRIYDWLSSLPRNRARKYSNRADFMLLLYFAERWQECNDALEQIKSGYANVRQQVAFLGWEGLLNARLGNRTRALEIIDELHQRPKARWREFRDFRECADIAAVLGEKEMAVNFLQQAFARGLTHDDFIHESIDLELLRGYPPFERLMTVK